MKIISIRIGLAAAITAASACGGGGGSGDAAVSDSLQPADNPVVTTEATQDPPSNTALDPMPMADMMMQLQEQMAVDEPAEVIEEPTTDEVQIISIPSDSLDGIWGFCELTDDGTASTFYSIGFLDGTLLHRIELSEDSFCGGTDSIAFDLNVGTFTFGQTGLSESGLTVTELNFVSRLNGQRRYGLVTRVGNTIFFARGDVTQAIFTDNADERFSLATDFEQPYILILTFDE